MENSIQLCILPPITPQLTYSNSTVEPNSHKKHNLIPELNSHSISTFLAHTAPAHHLAKAQQMSTRDFLNKNFEDLTSSFHSMGHHIDWITRTDDRLFKEFVIHHYSSILEHLSCTGKNHNIQIRKSDNSFSIFNPQETILSAPFTKLISDVYGIQQLLIRNYNFKKELLEPYITSISAHLTEKNSLTKPITIEYLEIYITSS